MSSLELLVNGSLFSGWEEANVSKSLEGISGAFKLVVSDIEPWPIGPGDVCELRLEGETVITGHIDWVSMEYEHDRHNISLAGRDSAGDLVDCGIEHPTGEFSNQTLLSLAKTLCKPFGVTVKADAPVGAVFPKFNIQPGETVWQAIERAARLRGLLVISDGRGGIVLTQPKSARAATTLRQGDNIKSARGDFDDSKRFSVYVVRGQSAGSDDVYGEAASSVSARATDAGVKRYRPRIISAETSVSTSDALQRAQYEAATQAARAGRVSVVVQGWREVPGGALWSVNKLVPVDLPIMRINGDMLICGLEFSLSDTGTLTTLDLVRPDGFGIEPVKKKGKVKSGITDDIFNEKKAA